MRHSAPPGSIAFFGGPGSDMVSISAIAHSLEIEVCAVTPALSFKRLRGSFEIGRTGKARG